jgi:hypothetical protein
MTEPDQSLMNATVTVPEQVVRREFSEEAIALNLDTGQYHGLNPIAAAMLDALEKGATGEEVAQSFASDYDQPLDAVRSDVHALLAALTDRGLVEVDAPGGD